MLKRTIAFKDLDNNPVETEYHFSLNKAELAEWMIVAPGGDLRAHLDTITKTRDGQKVFDTLRYILTKSVAIREGNRLVKNQDIIDDFMQTPAYEALFLELMVNNGAGLLDFIKQIVPEDMAAGFDEVKQEYSEEDLLNMSDDDFFAAVGRDETDWSKKVMLIAYRRKTNRAA